MTFKEAKKLKVELEFNNNEDSKNLRSFPRNNVGLTPDHIKASELYKECKQRYNESLKALQDFNKEYVKTFKSEIRKERDERFKNKAC